ncbi:non-ribosomal peptide synthetase [Sphaerisporangium corydalis]|uniref:Non-ribosomal peptide synthetase n=1 Tax=Sphaerisporangium corydalis TaxID=1441875 RepID=A0ABV9E6H7_9ACTN|nr:non-ribosomal peptide synthetase [Sphaerisporangium corydalis]
MGTVARGEIAARPAGLGDPPLSYGQERMWFLSRLEPGGGAAYNVFLAHTLTGPLDVAALGRAVAEIAARHEVLRTRYPSRDGEPVQVIDPPPPAAPALGFSPQARQATQVWQAAPPPQATPPLVAGVLELVDLTGLPAARREARAKEIAAERVAHEFDLAGEHPFRATLLRLSGDKAGDEAEAGAGAGNEDEDEHVLCVVFHHIAVDGWSSEIFFRELAALYETYTSENTPSTPPANSGTSPTPPTTRDRPHTSPPDGSAPHLPTASENTPGTPPARSGPSPTPPATGDRPDTSPPGRGTPHLPPAPGPPVPAIQYADYALWQRGRLGEVLEEQLGYWRHQLADPPVLDLPADRPRPPVTTANGGVVTRLLPASLTARIDELSRRARSTRFMTLMAAYQALLARYSGQDDICVGTPVAGRGLPELEPLIGLFVNTLVFRVDLSGDPTFRELLTRVRTTALGAYSNDAVPFDRLVSELNLARDLARTPLFQAQLVLYTYAGDLPPLKGLTTGPYDPGVRLAPFDLTAEFRQDHDGLRLSLIYNSDLFDHATAERMAGHFEALLRQATEDPGRRLSELDLLGAAERERLLAGWNDTAAPRPDATLPELVTGLPGATAVTCEGRTLTYAELEAGSNRLAHRLRREGVRPGVLVALCASRSPEMVVALLAVLKAGGAYLPLDPEYPRDRLAFVLADSGAALLLTEEGVRDRLPATGIPALPIDDPGLCAAEPASAPAPLATSGDLAYVIYTSGSTGRPKGVAVEHRALVNLLLSMADLLGSGPEHRWLALTSLSFDISGLELFLPLVTGGQVLLASSREAADPLALARLASTHAVTHVQATPSGWQAMLDAGFNGPPVTAPDAGFDRPAATPNAGFNGPPATALHAGFDRTAVTALVGGEALPLPLARALRERVRDMWNVYGPTETTIWSTCERVPVDPDLVTIGRPLANTQVYVLDERFEPVPVGVPGELFIGGAGVARDYLRRPALTAERFLPDPYGPPGSRLYRTGDRVRWLADGRLSFLGRADGQVKLRGHRVELGEVEAVLSVCPGVTRAVAAIHEDNLVAYVVGDASGVRAHAARSLPAVMVPSEVVPLAALPMTPNGKVDRKALPAPGRRPPGLDRPPATPMERRVAEVFSEVLRLDAVGADDDFFRLGGHSLLAVKATARMSATLGTEIPLREVFTNPTVTGYASALHDRYASAPGMAALHNYYAPDAFQDRNASAAPHDHYAPAALQDHNAPAAPHEAAPHDHYAPAAPHDHYAPAAFQDHNASAAPHEAALHDASTSTPGAPAPPMAAVGRRPGGGTPPLSPAQERLWFLHRLDPGDASYNMFLVWRLRGALDTGALAAALGDLTARHETLRTRYPDHDGVPITVVEPPGGLTVEHTDLSSGPGGVEGEARRIVAERTNAPFDLTAAPPFRVTLLRLAEDDHVLCLVLHHIAGDGWSLTILGEDLAEFHDARRNGTGAMPTEPTPTEPTLTEPTLTESTLRYGDVAYWRRGRDDGAALEYWRGQLAGPPVLELPSDRPRPEVSAHRGGFHSFALPPKLADRLERIGRERGATLFMVLLAAYQVLLARHTGQSEIMVGSPSAGRDRVEFERIVGYFATTLVLRGDLSCDPTFAGLLDRTRATVLAAMAHQDVPFEKVLAELDVPRDPRRTPLFQTMAILHSQDEGGKVTLGGVEPEWFDAGYRQAKFDLMLEAWRGPGGLSLVLGYDAELFDEATVAALADRFVLLCHGITAAPGTPISALPLLTPADRSRLATLEPADPPPSTSTPGDPPPSALAPGDPPPIALTVGGFVPGMVGGMTAAYPQGVAVSCGGEALTYAELERRVASLAARLRGRGVWRETVVGVHVGRSLDAVVALLAVWRAGGAYLPLDTELPPERKGLLIADSGAAMVLTRPHPPGSLPGDVPLLLIGGPQDTGDDPASNLTAAIVQAKDTGDGPAPRSLAAGTRGTDAAYVIYTSGSTGTPKGVVVEHQALAARVDWMRRAYALGPGDRVVQFASLSFDTHAEEIYPALAAGAAVELLPEGALTLPELLAGPRGREITVLDLPTAYWHRLVDQIDDVAWPGRLRLVILGGEQVHAASVARWRERFGDRVRLVNTYGPTEATIIATATDLGAADTAGRPPIGRPIAGTRAVVLGPDGRRVPPGAPGELHLGGAGLARHYLGRPELTAERFVAHPGEGRLYRTGDAVRWRADGRLEFLGRLDDQMKIRGFRVEPGEIEERLLALPGVRQAAVLARDDTLVAYVAGPPALPGGQGAEGLSEKPADRPADGPADKSARGSVGESAGQSARGSAGGSAQGSAGEFARGSVGGSGPLDPVVLRRALAAALPAYMVPEVWVVLDALPLTPGGKIDRRALPEPGLGGDRPFVAPRTDAEVLVAEIWQEVLRPAGRDLSAYPTGTPAGSAGTNAPPVRANAESAGTGTGPVDIGSGPVDVGAGLVGAFDDFFALGGHSLLAVQVGSRLRAVIGIEVPVRALFVHRTVADLAAEVERLLVEDLSGLTEEEAALLLEEEAP